MIKLYLRKVFKNIYPKSDCNNHLKRKNNCVNNADKIKLIIDKAF